MAYEVSMTGQSYESPRPRGSAISVSADESILVRSQAVVSRMVAGETLVVPVRGKVGDLASIYTFNATGSLVWKLLETPRTPAEIVAAVGREFDVAPEKAESDVRGFVRDLFSAGLVEVRNAVIAT
jgi:Coenzyme PQQ synthesis protein D (PqqD)